MSIGDLAPAVRSICERAGTRAFRELSAAALPEMAHAIPDLLPGNGVDESFRAIQKLLTHGTIVDVLGRPGGVNGLHVVVVEGTRGERILGMLRHGSQRDVAAERFFTDIAYAAGMEDFVTPMALAPDARSAVTQIIPHATLDAHNITHASELEHAMAAGYRADGMASTETATTARVDRELAASLDAITGHADRHGGNALLDARTGRLTLIDHELIGGGAYFGAHSGADLLHSLMQGGTRVHGRIIDGERVVMRRVQLSTEAIDHLAQVEPAAITAAHDRLAATPLPNAGDDMAAWIRSSSYRDRVTNQLHQIVRDGGWTYVPAS